MALCIWWKCSGRDLILTHPANDAKKELVGCRLNSKHTELERAVSPEKRLKSWKQ
jgi:hypothetical protein